MNVRPEMQAGDYGLKMKNETESVKEARELRI